MPQCRSAARPCGIVMTGEVGADGRVRTSADIVRVEIVESVRSMEA